MLDNRLERELLEYPPRPRQELLEYLPRDKQELDSFPHTRRLLKYYTLMCLSLAFLSYRVLYIPGNSECIRDLLHEYTYWLNWLLNNDESFYQWMIIVAQEAIEVNIFLLAIVHTIQVKNLRFQLLIGLFYAIRGILLNIERFPYPENIRWDAPWLPSLTVPYGITRDYFYSGHTGLMLFSTLQWYRLHYNYLFWPSLFLTPQVIIVLLSTRVAGACGESLLRQGSKYVVLFDKCWSILFQGLQEMVKYVRTFF